MLKIGLVRLLAVALFGLVIPLGAYRLGRRIGVRLVLLLAVALGLGYGALKAENPWSGDGLVGNLTLMAASALVLLAYVGLAIGAAIVVAKATSSFRA
jgi:hypothetical protein